MELSTRKRYVKTWDLVSLEVEGPVLDAEGPVYNNDGNGDDNYMEHNIHNKDRHKDNRCIHKYAGEIPYKQSLFQSCRK